MSGPLALAAVTAVLRDLLHDGLVNHDVPADLGGDFSVSSSPPDRVFPPNVTEENRLNLFLHRVTPNEGWRNRGLPSTDGRGNRVGNPPLALDLHYLLTAYGAEDLRAEILLGYGMQLLHETPVLTRGAIRKALEAPVPISETMLPPGLGTLSAQDIADQIEQIKITPKVFNCEEMGRMWMALQAHYRPSAAYLVSVVLIESTKAATSALPVLSRGPVDLLTQKERGVVAQPHLIPPFPTLEEASPPDRQIAVRMGEVLVVAGHHLEADQIAARFTHAATGDQLTIPTGSATRTGFEVTIPPDPANPPVPATEPMNPDNWRIGLHSLAAVIKKAGDPDRLSSELPVALAPNVTGVTASVTGPGETTVEVTCDPKVWRGQRALLTVGEHQLTAEQLTAEKTHTLAFKSCTDELPTGTQWVRLAVDGVSSIIIDRSSDPPTFHSSEQWAL